MKYIFLTMDGNHAPALYAAAERLRQEHALPITVACYDAASLRDAAGWARLERDLSAASFVFGARLFGEEYVRPLERLLSAATCPVLIITSNPALIRCTRIGAFSLAERDEGGGGILRQWVKKLRPQGGAGEAKRQLAVLRNLSKVLRLIPGKARDLYTYIVAHQYWLNSSPENLYRLLGLLVEGYAPGYKGKLPVRDPLSYPELALFHPAAAEPFADLKAYERWVRGYRRESKEQRAESREQSAGEQSAKRRGTVGLLTMRTVALSGNTAPLAALVDALERRGLEARLAYASGLDMRPALEAFFLTADTGRRAAPRSATVDLLVNASGFALVGGPAESRPTEARAALSELDVGYLGMVPLAFQRIEDWQRNTGGLAPLQAAMSIAVPELDGAADPLVIGGPSAAGDALMPLPEEIELAAERIAMRVALRHTPNAEKRLAVLIYNFPPNLGNIGTAAYLDVFSSLFNLLHALHADGYTVDLPKSVDELRHSIAEGNALLHGTDANVHAQFPVNDYRRLFPHEAAIEPYWGNAPGELLNDGRNFHIQGRMFGNIFIGVQPSFGYERDPMRLLMAQDAAPNHAFAAFYVWLREVFAADALIHFGTHGALEFMPGKQVGLSAACWPTRLLGGLPNFYYYSVNNPSEAAIAKRRGMATLVSYLVPPLQQAGLYKGLRALKDSLDRYRAAPSDALFADIQVQAEKLGMGGGERRAERGARSAERGAQRAERGARSAERRERSAEGGGHSTTGGNDATDAYIAALGHELLQIEERMIPAGLHVLGQAPAPAELVDFLTLVANLQPTQISGAPRTLVEVVAATQGCHYGELHARLAHDTAAQATFQALEQTCRALVQRFVARQTGSTAVAADPALLALEAQLAGTLAPLWTKLADLLDRLVQSQEIPGLLHGLRGGYIPPSASNDVVRDPSVVPTGRNVYSLDPYRVPTPTTVARGRQLADALIERLTHEQGAPPRSIGVVLWGSDNLKSECEGVAQVLGMLGARPVIDEMGNVADVALIPLSELGRPRIDAVVSVSGIFRDLLSNQMNLIDRAARLAAAADEPLEFNFVRANAQEQAQTLGISLHEASARVFANAPGSYGANVNHLVESSTWDEDGQISDAFLSRKGFTLSSDGSWHDSRALLERALGTVDASFQNVDSFEVGISDIDNYYENLGGMAKSVEALRGKRPAVVLADAMGSTNRLSSLEQMVRLETRAKLLNPKWYESMLAHGFEGVREIEARVNNTYGWGATAGAVDDWVYEGVAETYVLDDAMRERLAALNPHAAVGVVRRLLEAEGRGLWNADPATIDQLREIYADLEDRLEGIAV
jgi:magnesium chelatase subunit H